MKPFELNLRPSLPFVGAFVLGFSLLGMAPIAQAQGLPTRTWPAGTLLSNFDRGGRICTYHRGYVMLGAHGTTTTWDISDPTRPVKKWERSGGENGHRWWKMGDMYFREYRNPEVDGTPFKFVDLGGMPFPTPWSRNPSPIPVGAGDALTEIGEFPYRYAGWEHRLYDPRTKQVLGNNIFLGDDDNIASDNSLVIGNLYFMIPAVNGGGVSCYDLSDPASPRLASVISGQIFQYPTGIQVWKNYIVLLMGSDGNMGGNNMIAIDYSNPYNLRYAFGAKASQAGGRYAFFQDDYMFTGGDGVRKYNMRTKTLENHFLQGNFLNDFQPIPLGHLVMVSGGQSDGSSTTILTHMNGLDQTPPTVGHHWPARDAVNRSLRTYVGIVINETLNDLTVTPSQFQIKPVGGSPLVVDVCSSSYNVINVAPRSPLSANTTYEVSVSGVKDVAGNTIAPYSFFFATGSSIQAQVNNNPVISSLTSSPTSPVNRGATVTFTAAASDADGDPLQFRFDFGEGAGSGAWASTASVTRTVSTLGNFLVSVQVQDGKGGLATKTLSITVTDPIPAVQPTRSSSITLAPAARKVWVVNPDSDTVAALNADTMVKVHETAVGLNPTGVAVDASGQVWVTCRGDDTVRILTGSTGAQVKSIALARGSQPISIVFTPNGQTGFIAEHGTGRITRVDAASTSVSGSLSVGPSPRGLAVTADAAQLFVTRFISGNASGSIYTVNLFSFSAGATVPLSLDTTSQDTSATGRGLPNYVMSVAISPTSARAYATAKKDNILRGTLRNGQPMSFETTLRAMLAPIDTATKTDIPTQRIDVDNHELPSAVTFSPSGNHLFATFQGNNRIIAFDANNRSQVFRVDIGRAPQGLVIDPITKRVFVQNYMSRDVTVLDAKAMLDTGSPTLPIVQTVATVQVEKLTAQVLLGKQIFYNAADERMTTDGYMSCAVCHLDGDTDGRVWDFTQRGEGLRKTLPLRGRRGVGLGNVHWTANFDEIQDFENDIRTQFNGTGFMTDAQFAAAQDPLGTAKAGRSADLDALSAYVSSLDKVNRSPYRDANAALTAEAVQGKTLFQSLSCNSCHGGADFTDRSLGLLHNVGTIKASSGQRRGQALTGFGAPTLRGIWESAPYLHDGSANTLLDVLTTANTAGLHGATASLNAAQLNQLVAYLQQIDDSEPGFASLLAVSATAPMASEVGPVNGSVTIIRTTPLTGALTVNYSVSGTAQAGVDFQMLPGSVQFAAGSRTATIAIVPIADSLSEADETVIIALTGGGGGAAVGGAQATVSISDIDIGPQQPYGGIARSIPGKIQAEDYDTGGQGIAYSDADTSNNGGQYRAADGVDIELCTDTGIGVNVGWIVAGEYLEYTVNVGAGGDFDLALRVARQPAGTSAVKISTGIGSVFQDKTGSLAIPSTGGWQTWATVTKRVTLSAGRQVLRLDAVGADFNLNFIELTAVPTTTAGGATTAGSTSAGVTTAGVSTAGLTTSGATSAGATSAGATSSGGTTAGVTTSGGTTAGATGDGGGNVLLNGSFEADGATQTPSNWLSWSPNAEGSGGVESDYVEAAGGSFAGQFHLSHSRAGGFTIYTFQVRNGIANGTYTARVWARSSGGQGVAVMVAKNYGVAGLEKSADFGTAAISTWRQYEIRDIAVSNGSCEIGFYTATTANAWIYMDGVELVPQTSTPLPTSGTGLKGEYFNNATLSGTATLTRTDATVDFAWGNAPVTGLGADNFSVRWTGQVEAPVAATYTFHTRSDDGVRLWVNNVLIIDNWTDHAPADDNGNQSFALGAGQKVAVRMEFYERGGGAEARLHWAYPGQAKSAIPQIRLFP